MEETIYNRSKTKEVEYKTPVKDRTAKGKTAREEEEEIEEGAILVIQNQPMNKISSSQICKQIKCPESLLCKCSKRKEPAQQEKRGTKSAAIVVVTFNIQIGKGEATLKHFKN